LLHARHDAKGRPTTLYNKLSSFVNYGLPILKWYGMSFLKRL
jgi:hypothetical protein